MIMIFEINHRVENGWGIEYLSIFLAAELDSYFSPTVNEISSDAALSPDSLTAVTAK